jgi:hypothetical protein
MVAYFLSVVEVDDCLEKSRNSNIHKFRMALFKPANYMNGRNKRNFEKSLKHRFFRGGGQGG